MLRAVSLLWWVVLPIYLVSGCGSQPVIEQKEREVQDSGPSRPLNVDHIPEPVPRVEPRSSAGNISPYTVLGKTYKIVANPNGFRQKGVASWYGKKFHGKLTSNGELYDMYGMTAAHKTLPIPSYVRVTNIENRRSIIVRVNDRGPFHSGRIIDLTYTAAKKLGFSNKGTAPVTLEYIDPATYSAGKQQPLPSSSSAGERLAPTPQYSAGYAIPENTFLQVGAFSKKVGAESLKVKLAAYTQYPIHITNPKGRKDKFYRVRIGPLKDNLDLMTLRQTLIDKSFPEPHVVYQ